MSTRKELEKKAWFRLGKVVLWLVAIVLMGFTLLIAFVAKGTVLDASQAYFICNSGTAHHDLQSTEKDLLQVSHTYTFEAGSAAQIRINKECYQEYSGGKDPDLATSDDISFFRSMQAGNDGRVYTVQGIQTNDDWHLGYVILALVIEYALLQGLKFAGLYIAGGKEALG